MLGTLNFVTPGNAGEVRFVLDNGWTGTGQRPCPVELTDLRGSKGRLSLDREGFVLDRIVSGVTDYSDPDQIAGLWFPAVKQAILRITGGSWAVLFAGPNIRFSERNPASANTPVSAPARAVHSDLHDTFTYPQIARQPHAEAAWSELTERLGGREPARWRIFNIWQILSAPPQDTSLALCSLPSVGDDDYVRGQGYFAEPGHSAAEVLAQKDNPPMFDITFLREKPAQQWCCFSDMLPGEALIFSTFDPQAGPGFARVPHGAVDIPNAPRNAVPRSSIEVRALVVFEE